MSTKVSQKAFSPAGSQGRGGRGGYNNPPKTEYMSNPAKEQKRHQTHAVSGYDLTEYVMKEKRYADMTPMERFLYQGGSSLERKSTKKVPKGLL